MALNAENCKTWWSVIISCQVLSNPPERLTKKLEQATKLVEGEMSGRRVGNRKKWKVSSGPIRVKKEET